jgi:DNA (cytosine-5)-methyltransferase 1
MTISDITITIQSNGTSLSQQPVVIQDISHTLRGDGFDASEDGTGLGTPIVPDVAWALQERDSKGPDSDTKEGHLIPVAYNIQHNDGGKHKRKDRPNGGLYVNETDISLTVGTTDVTAIVFKPGQSASARTLGIGENIALSHEAGGGGNNKPAVCYDMCGNGDGNTSCALTGDHTGRPTDYTPVAVANMAVRRLTPEECEKLQGFPIGYTKIAWRNKLPELCPDGPRYKALGNSMATPVIKWIGERIQAVKEIINGNQ